MHDNGRLSVLIVDDDAAVLSALRRALKGAPAAIRWAGSVEEALALVTEAVPDLVISDYQLQGSVDGLTLLNKIREQHPGTRCVLHTGEPVETTLRVSTVLVLFKPCPTSVLLELMESVRGECFRREA